MVKCFNYVGCGVKSDTVLDRSDGVPPLFRQRVRLVVQR